MHLQAPTPLLPSPAVPVSPAARDGLAQSRSERLKHTGRETESSEPFGGGLRERERWERLLRRRPGPTASRLRSSDQQKRRPMPARPFRLLFSLALLNKHFGAVGPLCPPPPETLVTLAFFAFSFSLAARSMSSSARRKASPLPCYRPGAGPASQQASVQGASSCAPP